MENANRAGASRGRLLPAGGGGGVGGGWGGWWRECGVLGLRGWGWGFRD